MLIDPHLEPHELISVPKMVLACRAEEGEWSFLWRVYSAWLLISGFVNLWARGHTRAAGCLLIKNRTSPRCSRAFGLLNGNVMLERCKCSLARAILYYSWAPPRLISKQRLCSGFSRVLGKLRQNKPRSWQSRVRCSVYTLSSSKAAVRLLNQGQVQMGSSR